MINFRLPGDRLPLQPYSPPIGLRPGERRILATGEQSGSNFTAGWGSQLNIAGGQIGNNLEAVGAQVNLLKGAIGQNADALFGTEFNVRGGTIDYGFEAHRGSVVNISGGTVPEITVRTGGSVQITGGTLGDTIAGEFRGGMLRLEEGGQLHLTGLDFRFGGKPVDGLSPGSTIHLNWEDTNNSVALQGTLADGSPLLLYISNDRPSYFTDWNFAQTLTISLTATVPGDFDGNLVVDAADYTDLEGQSWRQV